MRDNFENHRLRTLLWIVKQLEERPMSLKELNLRWTRDVSLSGGLDIERRTFFNYIRAIDDLLHITIECERSGSYRYRIVEKERSSLRQWMQKNFEQQLALERGFDLGDRIIMEEAPRGQKHLEMLICAMTNNMKVHIRYADFNSDDEEIFDGAPYALKLYQQRWYVVIKDDEDEQLYVLSLDRILEMEVLGQQFQMDPSFDAREFFKHSFGVRVIPDEEPREVLLKVKAAQVPYMRSLPLHPSQVELEYHPGEYSIFQLTVVPTIELTMKLLSMGLLVEVLAPQDLREAIANEAMNLYQVYHGESKKEIAKFRAELYVCLKDMRSDDTGELSLTEDEAYAYAYSVSDSAIENDMQFNTPQGLAELWTM